ncbi:MAG: hypothetical protein CML22_14070 [Rheinheimera sp.]|nr:hypothetical protein [Rheinheimera sp.]MBM35414.1 hypothetical protein [Rheinheimera sp.]
MIVSAAENRFYSSLQVQLFDLMSDSEAMRKKVVEVDLRTMQNYPYPFASWPLILSSERIKEIARFVEFFPKVLLKVIKETFGNNAQALANYVNEPLFICEMMLNMGVDPKDMLIRHDIIISGQKIKLLEVNAGSTIGGWQLDWLAGSFLRVLQAFPETALWNVKSRPIVENLFTALVASIKRIKGPGATGNIVMAVMSANHDNDEFVDDAILFFDEQFRLARKGSFPNGKLSICRDVSDLEFKPGGDVFMNGEIVDAFFIPVGDTMQGQDKLYYQLTSSSLRNKLVFPDSPHRLILGNKNLLALMHEALYKIELTDEERKLITENIPWGAKLNSKEANWQSEKVELRPFLMEKQHSLVIKKAHSFQGLDVFIGKDCSPEEWQEIIEKYGDDNDWLVQEYCKPDAVSVCHPQDGIVGARAVWGIFDFGNQYSGAFIRAATIGMNDGVINSARGAIELYVMEEAAHARKMVI